MLLSSHAQLRLCVVSIVSMDNECAVGLEETILKRVVLPLVSVFSGQPAMSRVSLFSLLKLSPVYDT